MPATLRRPARLAVVLALGVAAAALAWVLHGRVSSRPSGGTPAQGAARHPDHPNVVLIVLDTLRADRVGAYGVAAPDGVSPELDALAERGVRFARAISQSSWTRPSIGSFLTSRYPREIGIFHEHGDALPPRVTTLAEALHAAGYRTLGLTANPNLNRAFNFHQGFDEYVDSWVVWRWMTPEPGQQSERDASLPSAPELLERALEMVRRDPGTPTYLQIDLMEIHEHHRSADMIRPEYRDLYDDRPDQRYVQSLRQLSYDVGGFVAELGRIPGWEDTLVVVTSDHGEGLDSHPHVANSHLHGRLLYESHDWVPLILYSPGDLLPRGRVVERPTRMLDLMPTLLDYVGVPAPEEAVGVSLRPLVDSDQGVVDLPEYFVVETEFRDSRKIGLYGADLKLIHNIAPQPGAAPLELQPNRIEEDGLRTDVGGRQPDDREAMRLFLARWLQEHPRAAPWHGGEGPSTEEVRQLRAIGYAQ